MIYRSCCFLLFFFFYFFQANASSMTGFCLAQKNSLTQAKKWLEGILAPGDEIHLRSSLNCLEVKHDKSLKKELYEKYLARKFPIKRVYTSLEASNAAKKESEPCKIQLEYIGSSEKHEKSGTLSEKDLKLSEDRDKTQKRSTSTLLLSQGKWGEFEYKEKKYRIKCFLRGTVAEVKIKSQSSDSSFMTDLQFQRGVKQEIGSHLEKSEGENNKLATNEMKVLRERLKENLKIYLEIR